MFSICCLCDSSVAVWGLAFNPDSAPDAGFLLMTSLNDDLKLGCHFIQGPGITGVTPGLEYLLAVISSLVGSYGDRSTHICS